MRDSRMIKAIATVFSAVLFVAVDAVAGSDDSNAAPAMPPHIKPVPKIGDRGRSADTIACPTTEELGRVLTLVGKKDTSGAETYIADKCIDLPGGMEFTIDDVSAKLGAFCGRSRDSTRCLWMPRDALEDQALDSPPPTAPGGR